MTENQQAKKGAVPVDLISKFSIVLPREILGWQQARGDEIFTRDNIFDYLDGAGEIYLAYDFHHLFVRQYTKEGAPSLVVEIYQMSSSADAYGIYTNDTDGESAGIGQDSVYGAGLLRFWKNNIFVRVQAEKETDETKSLVMRLGKVVADSVRDEGTRPDLIRFIPAEGLLPQSLRYFHKVVILNAHYYLANVNILGLDEGTEAVLARYQLGNSRAWLLLVRYEAPAPAGEAFQKFVRIFLKDKPVPDGGLQAKKLEDGKFACARQSARHLILVFEAPDFESCQGLVGAILKKTEAIT